MQRSKKFCLYTLLLILIDQLLKAVLVKYSSFVSLNSNGAFSISFLNIDHLYISLAGLAIIIVLSLYDKKIITNIGFYLIVSGGISNIIDRISRGGVVDYIDLGFFPSFNLADSLITLGVVALIIDLFFAKKINSSLL